MKNERESISSNSKKRTIKDSSKNLTEDQAWIKFQGPENRIFWRRALLNGGGGYLVLSDTGSITYVPPLVKKQGNGGEVPTPW